MDATLLNRLADHPVILQLGWMLVHFIWQAGCLGLITALILRALRGASPHVRYAVAGSGLGLIAILPLLTLGYLVQSDLEFQNASPITLTSTMEVKDTSLSTRAAWIDTETAQPNQTAATANLQDSSDSASLIATPPTSGDVVHGSSWIATAGETVRGAIGGCLPILVGLWFVGVLILALRLSLGLYRIECWKRRSLSAIDPQWTAVVARLAHRMGLRQSVRILSTEQIGAPAVLGWWRPTLLVSASSLSGLTIPEVEAIFAHELAHIRRHDYLVNLLQTAIETLFFFHPAVWWLSRQIRIEREHCCDDEAITLCESPMVLAKALASLETRRCQRTPLALAADGSSLVVRIRRLLAVEIEPRQSPSWWPVAIIGAAFSVLVVSGVVLGPLNPSAEAASTLAPSLPSITQETESSPQTASGAMTVISEGLSESADRTDRSGWRAVAKHTYSQSRRTSKRWIEVQGAQRPVDEGVSHAGTTIYMTLMNDIIAIDEATENVLWTKDWNKGMPFWKTLTIVVPEADPAGEPLLELFAVKPQTGEKIYEYRLLKTGEQHLFPDTKRTLPAEPEAVVSPDQKAVDTNVPATIPVDIVERADARIRRAVIVSPDGMPAEHRAAFKVMNTGAGGNPGSTLPDFVTHRETLVTVSSPRYLELTRLDAPDAQLHLPFGSQLRAEFHGQDVQLNPSDEGTQITVTDGRLDLLDRSGVIRAQFWPDGGAELLEVKCRQESEGITMRLNSAFVKNDQPDAVTLINIILNPDSGAPADERAPAHGSVRYAVGLEESDAGQILHLRRNWRFHVQRLLREFLRDIEAETDSGGSPVPLSLPLTTRPIMAQKAMEQDSEDERPWGALAENSGLRSRLTCLTENPEIGKPLRFKLEVKNFGDKATIVDLQRYTPHRVLRAMIDLQTGRFATFIGATPQTFVDMRKLEPGESLTVWDDVDARSLFLLPAETYTFFAEGGEWATQTLWRDSNQVTIELREGPLDPGQRFIQQILEQVPENWKLTNGLHGVPGQQDPGRPHLFLNHQPSNEKQDPSSIQIWFTDSPLPDDFKLGRGAAPQDVARLGRTELGHLNVAAPPGVQERWPEYLQAIAQAANASIAEPPDDDEQRTFELAQKPWLVIGRITDSQNNPLSGVTVKAFCGVGSLQVTGSTQTDRNGRYRLRFGSAFFNQEPVGLQAATITAIHDGYYETNLGRQGDLLAALASPADEALQVWGRERDDVILPEEIRTIDFTFRRAAPLSGRVIAASQGSTGPWQVSLTGEALPPSSSVLATTQTRDDGSFSFDGIPVGLPYQIVIQSADREKARLNWSTPPLIFERGSSHVTRVGYRVGEKDDSREFDRLHLILVGSGENLESATTLAKNLEPVWRPSQQAAASLTAPKTQWLQVGGQ